jgi:hypothetical protein
MPVRLLHFTSAELAWECTTELNRECECISEPVSDNTFVGNLVSSQLRLQKPQDGDFLSSWYRVVEELTTRRLTYDTDRLPTLSGLVLMTAEQTRRSYAAGLCGEELAIGMVWLSRDIYHTGERFPCRRQEKYHAPSWSWASITGMITYDSRITKPSQRNYNFTCIWKGCKGFPYTVESESVWPCLCWP